MNTKLRLHFEILTTLVYAFLALLCLLLISSFSQSKKKEANDSDLEKTEMAANPKTSKTIQLGKKLFKNKCGSCHAKNMKSKMTGPPLAGVEKRWESKENLFAWIRNSQVFLATGDAYAKQLFLEYGGNPMPPFSELSDEDIDAILEYINFKSN